MSLSSFRSESLIQEFIKLPPVWDVRFTQIVTRQRSYAAKNVLNITKQPGTIEKRVSEQEACRNNGPV